MELVRANRVVVKNEDNGNLVGEFWRTHKYVVSVKLSELPENLAKQIPRDGNKSQIREKFRSIIKKNADKFGVNYDDTDRRMAENKRKPRYTTDQELIEDVTTVVNTDLPALVSKCKYDVTYGGVVITNIKPKSKTGSGTQLSQLGISDGKYKNGNWAWADIMTEVTVKYKSNNPVRIYLPIQLVSGQIKKTKITITEFNELVMNGIVDCGYATEQELNPPKTKNKKTDDKPEIYESSTIKKMKKDELYKYAKKLGIEVIEDMKFQTVRSMVIKKIKELKGE